MTLLTPWGESLDREAPLPEYPRPQLVREGWQNLNGPWRYAVTPFAASDPVAVADPLKAPSEWSGEIVVPFSPETVLSGTGWTDAGRRLHADETLWYRRSFRLAPVPATHRVLLHFGAVDQSAVVAVDGVRVGGHTGGYTPFTLDITDALAADDTHELTVAVRDVTDASWLSRGKQSSKRGGIWYTPQSGIWQTVWLEVVPRVAVDRLVLVPDLDGVEVTVVSEHAAPGTVAAVRISGAGEVAASVSVAVGEAARIAIPGARRWSPEDPFLYDIEVTLGEDRVRSYTGLRTVGMAPDAHGVPRLTLNGEPYLHVGLLDQGYWPDGGYTAPSDAALEYDVRLAKDLGYNMLRKHIKIEPLRWYHHCDRLGILVWQDVVNGGGVYNPLVVSAPAIASPVLDDRKHRRFGRADAAGRGAYRVELVETIEHLRSVPSVVLWVPFNEGWGQFDAAAIAAEVRTLDPTRPIDHASGWHDQGAGDLHSLHVYFRAFRVKNAWSSDPRALALTEYGGYSLVVPGHEWGERVFGYKKFTSAGDLETAFVRLHDREIAPAVARGLAAIVYTQLSDVEDEVNGLVTYDRRVVKIPAASVRAVNEKLVAAATAASEGSLT
ncbi:glycosyl hydrolase family 2 [Microbacterium sp. Root61]|uniref:glycoside hydrolase family 2 protein n=1 Tax=Microbacterium sp. Root61 TaxID=1736570 RepID=UPI000700BC7A|nr:glycoside hydrolase family 2 [Microbacterium sp. Root61]KRA24446.1 glycosyl hydrolase family 2 [Microbacterium sp. Root61]